MIPYLNRISTLVFDSFSLKNLAVHSSVVFVILCNWKRSFAKNNPLFEDSLLEMSGGINGGTQAVSENDIFDRSGPKHLTVVDWNCPHHRRSVTASLVRGVYVLERDRHRRSVTASLVRGVYVLERDRQENRHGYASPWWEFFHFQLLRHLEDAGSSIFGAIYEFKPPSFGRKDLVQGAPKYVVAFRGTITKGDCPTVIGDLIEDIKVLGNCLDRTSRSHLAMQTVQSMVEEYGHSNIWIAGHSLGSAMAMLVGKNIAKTGIFLEAFLFNPPFISVPIEWIENTKVKRGIRTIANVTRAAVTRFLTDGNQRQRSDDLFIALSKWAPSLFVHPADLICSEYIGYFEIRETMEDIGAGGIGRLATQNSISSLVLNADKESEPLHLLPSACLTKNLSPAAGKKQAHGIRQWWEPDLHIQSKRYQFDTRLYG